MQVIINLGILASRQPHLGLPRDDERTLAEEELAVPVGCLLLFAFVKATRVVKSLLQLQIVVEMRRIGGSFIVAKLIYLFSMWLQR